MDFTEKVSALAQAHNISINALRLKIGVGNGTLQGHGDPRFSTVVKVADFFGVPLDYFLDNDKSVKPAAGMILSREEQDIIKSYRIASEKEKNTVATVLEIKRQDTGLRSEKVG